MPSMRLSPVAPPRRLKKLCLKTCAIVRCAAGTVCEETPSGPVCKKRKPLACPCPKIYRPVCCLAKSGEKDTKGNACMCRCNGSVVSQGKCNSPPPTISLPITCRNKLCADGSTCEETSAGPLCKPNKPLQCKCSAVLAPVCCAVSKMKASTLQNACSCACRGGLVLRKGVCDKPVPTCANRSCPSGFKCVSTKNGSSCQKVSILRPPRLPVSTCVNTSCLKGEKCIMVENRPKCEQVPNPKITCDSMDCLAGQTCVETKRGPKCRKDLTPKDTCYNVDCLAGQTCVETKRGPKCRTCKSKATAAPPSKYSST